MQAFVPKNRKPKFDLTLNIVDLTNIPLVVGHVCIKWHLPSSSAAEHRGRTDKVKIRDHKATWEYTKELSVRLTIDKTSLLQPCEIHFEVLQEYDSGKGGRVHLGNIKLNLSEYTSLPELGVDDAPEEDGMITRRYLMQDSKVNATLKIGIAMKQTDGDTNFISPPLKSAMVIGGIAGIMSAEAGETEDMPSLASKSRELAEAQDIYRRTLAATWACERGQLPPDQLIEDLFSGGDGGRMGVGAPPRRGAAFPRPLSPRDDSSTSDDADSKRGIVHALLTPEMAKTGHRRGGNGNDPSSSQNSNTSAVSGRGSIEQQIQLSQSHHQSHHHHHHHHRRKRQPDPRDVTEFDLRDDLKSWQIHVN